MAGNQKFPSDLLFVAGLVILTDIFVLIPVLSESFIRTALSLPLMLFLPGYALIAMLFPEKTGLEGHGKNSSFYWVERCGCTSNRAWT